MTGTDAELMIRAAEWLLQAEKDATDSDMSAGYGNAASLLLQRARNLQRRADFTPAPWVDTSPGQPVHIGKVSYGSIVAPESFVDEERSREEYGGDLICESVNQRNRPLIVNAPHLYAVCRKLCDWQLKAPDVDLFSIIADAEFALAAVEQREPDTALLKRPVATEKTSGGNHD